MKNKMKSSKMLKKADALKGFLGSMSKKKGQMGMGVSPTITPEQSKRFNVPVGEKYRTTPIPTDPMRPKMRTNYSDYGINGPNANELSAYVNAKKGEMEKMRQKINSRIPIMGGKPSMKKGGSFPDLNKDGEITKADILMGRGVIGKSKGQKGMNVMKEAKKNATPSIPHSYYSMGGMKEMNPLASMIKKKSMKKSPMKPGMKPAMMSGMKPKMAMGGDFFPQNPLTMSKYQNDNLDNQYYKKGGMVKKKKK